MLGSETERPELYLKSLTLRGFKSFASATTLSFEPGITCVVGPNGSGKSNVVDALSWVMGEQGAKSLRGGKMEDVIFAGTSGRAPLGRAEVVLTIDNADGALPIDYAEVTITRTMFRNGGSEYAINSHQARLLDIQDLLSDSGIGREMHVVVGQGQLDSILQATPEARRGFIEEAAGVLKHRKRKEKALRKLEACEGNLNRLSDLIGEIRRQLKPLGRQAEVARKAAVIQAEARDARARLLAEELLEASQALESDLATEQETAQRRLMLEAALEESRRAEVEAEEALRACVPRLTAAQETWYSLAALRERVATTLSIAHERMRNADDDPGEVRFSRDPDELEREAAAVSGQEQELAAQVAAKEQLLADATAHRVDGEQAHQVEENRLAGLLRAAADRREGLARLAGKVSSLRSRAAAAEDEIGRLTVASEQAAERAEHAALAFTARETTVAGLDASELGLDADHEAAVAALEAIESELAQLRRDEAVAGQERAGFAARVEALHVGLDRRDGSSALLAATDQVDGLLGSVAALVSVRAGYETAIAAAFGAAAEAVAVAGLDAAVGAFDHLKAADLGRAGLLLGGSEPVPDEGWPELPVGVGYAVDVVEVPAELGGAVRRVLRKVAIVPDLAVARSLVQALPDIVAVTLDGDLLSAHFGSGGSSAQPSLIEVQAAIEDAEQRLEEANHACERLRFAQNQLEESHRQATAAVEATLARLHESDAAMAALAEELGQLSSTVRSAQGEADRLGQAIAQAEAARDRDVEGLAELEHRLEVANDTADDGEPDPTVRDRLAEEARLARSAEMDARLALRTLEERVRALAGRADALRRAAAGEREARARALARRERLIREAKTAAAVHVAGSYLADRVAESLALAATERAAAEAARTDGEQALAAARATVRKLAVDTESLLNSAHRDELARAEQRMRVAALVEKAMNELGLEAAVLIEEFGPDQPVPVLTREDGSALDDDERPDPVPYVREQQQRRLRAAERELAILGKVNPLALEEFDAIQERHRFLSEQLEDLRRTRQDLLGIIEEVDSRVEQVFAEAYADVEQAFERVFARLFPGGEGHLVLTEPDSWLTTGVDVEARPPGKKIKRLSLLSGGERSLVAVAFLVSLFIARPSPFYILDEVEAALDDVNLGRLLEIYEELRVNSQLLVITHQKRTMEIADALYGVTMRGDGVSAVISQRLREPAA